MLLSKLLTKAERIARAVAPVDLAGKPLYFISPATSRRFTLPMLRGAAGCFIENLDEMLEDELRAAGRWVGPGLAIVVDTELPSRLGLDECEAERNVAGIVLHEIAHFVTTAPKAGSSGTLSDRFTAIAEAASTPQPAMPPIPTFYWSHGREFTRVCCHLAHRTLTRGGMPMRAKWISFAGDYPTLEPLGPPHLFAEALADELDCLIDEPLRNLASIEPPHAFYELWSSREAEVYAAAAAKLVAA